MKRARRLIAVIVAMFMLLMTFWGTGIGVKAESFSKLSKREIKKNIKISSVSWSSGSGKQAKFKVKVNVSKDAVGAVKPGEVYTVPMKVKGDKKVTFDNSTGIATPQEGHTFEIKEETDGSVTWTYEGVIYWHKSFEASGTALEAIESSHSVIKDTGAVVYQKSGNNEAVANTLNAILNDVIAAHDEVKKCDDGLSTVSAVLDKLNSAKTNFTTAVTAISAMASTYGLTQEDLNALNTAGGTIDTAIAAVNAYGATFPEDTDFVDVGFSVFNDGDYDDEVMIGSYTVAKGETVEYNPSQDDIDNCDHIDKDRYVESMDGNPLLPYALYCDYCDEELGMGTYYSSEKGEQFTFSNGYDDEHVFTFYEGDTVGVCFDVNHDYFTSTPYRKVVLDGEVIDEYMISEDDSTIILDQELVNSLETGEHMLKFHLNNPESDFEEFGWAIFELKEKPKYTITNDDFMNAYDNPGKTYNGVTFSGNFNLEPGDYTLGSNIGFDPEDQNAPDGVISIYFGSGSSTLDLDEYVVDFDIRCFNFFDVPPTLTITGEGAVIGEVWADDDGIIIIEGGNFGSTLCAQYDGKLIINDAVVSNVSGPALSVLEKGNLEVHGGKFVSDAAVAIVVQNEYDDDSVKPGTVFIEDGYFKGLLTGMFIDDAEAVNISGGEFEGGLAGLCSNYPVPLNLQGGKFTSFAGDSPNAQGMESAILLEYEKEEDYEDSFATILGDDYTFSPKAKTVFKVQEYEGGKAFLGVLDQKVVEVVSAEEEFWPFSDYDENAKLAEDILYAYKNGIVSGSGKPDDNGRVLLKGDKDVIRSQFAIMIYSMEGRPSIDDIPADQYNYSDVSTNAAEYAAVKWASAHGIISGYSNGKFKPTSPITRAQIAMMLKRYADYKQFSGKYAPNTITLDTFTDYDQIQENSKDGILWAVNNEIISGIGTITLKMKPNSSARRDQCVAFCARFHRKFMNE